MCKKVLIVVILIALMLLAEIISNLISMDFIITVFYIILGLGFICIVKEELL